MNVPISSTVIVDRQRDYAESLAAGAKWLVFEHDKPADPAGSVEASLAHLKRLEAA